MRSSVVRTGRSDNSGGDRILSINITLLLTPVSVSRFTKENTDKGITGESGMVVLGAIAINTSNFFVKLVAWAYTGSHSMFSEVSVYTGNQTFIYKMKPSSGHPQFGRYDQPGDPGLRHS